MSTTKAITWRTVELPNCALCGKRLPRSGSGVWEPAPGVYTHMNNRCPKRWDKAAHDALIPSCTSCEDLMEHRGANMYFGDTFARHIADKGA